ncbi:lactate utilization protein, partial [Bacteroides fragilis]|nr:lactate utilization protein [Bacteroides fragilis]
TIQSNRHQALKCIRCSACLNVCPVYERAGGHAYGSVYPGPIGISITPQPNRYQGPPRTIQSNRHQALKCIRCSACLNVCPVYERAGGHA